MHCDNWGSISLAKSIGPRQPALTAQADMGRNFSLYLNFLHRKGPLTIMTQLLNKNGYLWINSHAVTSSLLWITDVHKTQSYTLALFVLTKVNRPSLNTFLYNLQRLTEIAW